MRSILLVRECSGTEKIDKCHNVRDKALTVTYLVERVPWVYNSVPVPQTKAATVLSFMKRSHYSQVCRMVHECGLIKHARCKWLELRYLERLHLIIEKSDVMNIN